MPRENVLQSAQQISEREIALDVSCALRFQEAGSTLAPVWLSSQIIGWVRAIYVSSGRLLARIHFGGLKRREVPGRLGGF